MIKLYYSNELYHHGIEGQKWGVRNGPPYPLDRSTSNRIKSYGERLNRYYSGTVKDKLADTYIYYERGALATERRRLNRALRNVYGTTLSEVIHQNPQFRNLEELDTKFRNRNSILLIAGVSGAAIGAIGWASLMRDLL